VTGVARLYRSLDLPGFAHHVLALRVAGGLRDERATDAFEVGGTSGSSLDLAPGVAVGGSRRTFPVRGFSPGARRGTRAVAVSAEYRAPIAAPGAGRLLGLAFLDRISMSAFADAGTAWCPAPTRGGPDCTAADTTREWIASAGAELNLDTALQYDAPYRFRLGVALPIQRSGTLAGTTRPVTGYVTVGLAF
jgi:hemolysin activation/secretion protein